MPGSVLEKGGTQLTVGEEVGNVGGRVVGEEVVGVIVGAGVGTPEGACVTGLAVVGASVGSTVVGASVGELVTLPHLFALTYSQRQLSHCEHFVFVR